ncbi:MAG: hypothetical protein JSV42_05355 [Chloroflexota bacterium]|nr:MAG: hypothetical protein JSV42_05355 [Chloroflexota bacterium]
MESKPTRVLILMLGLFLITAIVFGLSGERGAAAPGSLEIAAQTDTNRRNISFRIPETLSDQASTFWTEEQMLSAQPYPLLAINEPPRISLESPQPDGLPGVIPGFPPEAAQLLSADSETQLAFSEAAALGYDYPPPYARYQNFDSYKVYPYSTVGVLFFNRGGKSFSCTAASIGNSAIWTAGHCIHEGDGQLDSQGNVIDWGTWSTDVLFVPARRNSSTPYGVWTANELWITPEWFDGGDLRYDMAGVVLNQNGGTISQVVGTLGFSYNRGGSLHWMNIAYPADPPFNGLTQQICAGSFAYRDTYPPSPYPVAMGCDMTGGSSGGPWILNFGGSTPSQNYLNGNNSYRYPSHPEEIYSPYFDSDAKSLWDDLVGIIN